MDFLNVATFGTSSSSTKVLVLDGNTVKSRTAAQVVTDGGGSSGSTSFYQATIFGAIGNGTSDSVEISTGKSSYGWPYDGNGDQADSKLRCCKFVIPFKPANYRISVVCTTAVTYSAGTEPSGGNFGIKFQRATTNSTNDADWTDIGTLNFKGKTIGDLASINGTLSISGTDTLFYIRTLQMNDLSSSASDASIGVRSFVMNFWS
jgi:hypothetical protein